MKVSQDRVTIDLAGVDLGHIIKRSKYAGILEGGAETGAHSQDDLQFLLGLIEDGLYELFEFIVNRNTRLVTAKTSIDGNEFNFAELILK